MYVVSRAMGPGSLLGRECVNGVKGPGPSNLNVCSKKKDNQRLLGHFAKQTQSSEFIISHRLKYISDLIIQKILTSRKEQKAVNFVSGGAYW